jgi:hypothetical protein
MKAFIIILMLSFMVGISSPVGAQEAPLNTPPPVTSLMVKLKARALQNSDFSPDHSQMTSLGTISWRKPHRFSRRVTLQ